MFSFLKEYIGAPSSAGDGLLNYPAHIRAVCSSISDLVPATTDKCASRPALLAGIYKVPLD
jgi:hypothetical protein